MSNTTQILHRTRVGLGMDRKISTNPEGDIRSNTKSRAIFSPSSPVSDVISDITCRHKALINQTSYDTCSHCGAFVSKNGIGAFKSKKSEYLAFFPPETIYETMTRRSEKFKTSLNPAYAEVRQSNVETMLEMAAKLTISNISTHLGILILDTIMFKNPSLNSKLKLYTPICLLVAAKAIELDERIPYLPKLRRYASGAYSLDEYKRAELHVLDMIDWNPQFSSFLEITEFLMCQGFIFSSDEVADDEINTDEKIKWSPEALKEINRYESFSQEMKSDNKLIRKISSSGSKDSNDNQNSDTSTNETLTENPGTPCNKLIARFSQIEDGSPSNNQLIPRFLKQNSASPVSKSIEKKALNILKHFETNYMRLCNLLLKDTDLIEWEPKVIAASVVAFFRNVNRVTPLWNGELEAMTRLKYSQIYQCLEVIDKKYNVTFNTCPQKSRIIIYTGDQKAAATELTSPKANSPLNQNIDMKSKFEFASKLYKLNLVADKYAKPNSGQPDSGAEPRSSERKSIFDYKPPRSNVPSTTTNASSSSSSGPYGYLRDESRNRNRYVNEILSSKVPSRQTKDAVFSENQHFNRNGPGSDHSKIYYNNARRQVSGSTSIDASGSYYAMGNPARMSNESYVANSNKNSGSGSALLSGRVRNSYQTKLVVSKR